MWATEEGTTKKIVFSGDIGNKSQPLIKDPSLTESADYVVMESTYGDRLHSQERPDYVGELTAIIQETLDKGGNVVSARQKTWQVDARRGDGRRKLRQTF